MSEIMVGYSPTHFVVFYLLYEDSLVFINIFLKIIIATKLFVIHQIKNMKTFSLSIKTCANFTFI